MSVAISPEILDTQITVWSKRLALVLLGWFAHSATVGTLDLHRDQKTLAHVQTVEIPKLKSAVKCEDTRADRASVVAGQAIVAATVDGVRVPSPSEMPKDNCPHPAGVK